MHDPCTKSVPEPAAAAGTPAARFRQSTVETRRTRAVRPSRSAVNHRYPKVVATVLRFLDQARHRRCFGLSAWSSRLPGHFGSDLPDALGKSVAIELRPAPA
jgi:hypothetical protein